MGKLDLHIDASFEQKCDHYPDHVRDKMLRLKDLVIETAEETPGVNELTMTLKWGEPGFVAKNGSTFRMDWKEKSPEQYAIYFQCTSRLIETFQLVFDRQLTFEGKRAIIFRLDEKLPTPILKDCIRTALTYHNVKHLLTLGL